MWFRNLIVLRAPSGWDLDADALADALAPQRFDAAGPLDETRVGWVPPLDGESAPVLSVAGQCLIALRHEKKLLPARVIAQVVKARADAIEAQDGFRPGRRRLRELKDAVRDELLPRAFSIASDTRAWIDPKAGWLAIDAASQARADELVGALAKALEPFPARPLRSARPVGAEMTAWLLAGEAPAGFAIDQDVELKARDTKATVRWAHQSIDAADVTRHAREGKQCTRLALTWRDRVSFVLTDALALRRVRPLDVLQQDAGSATPADARERFDTDFALMTGELSGLLDDLLDALGGAAAAPGAAAAAPPPLARAA